MRKGKVEACSCFHCNHSSPVRRQRALKITTCSIKSKLQSKNARPVGLRPMTHTDHFNPQVPNSSPGGLQNYRIWHSTAHTLTHPIQLITQVFRVCVCGPPGPGYENSDLNKEKCNKTILDMSSGLLFPKRNE